VISLDAGEVGIDRRGVDLEFVKESTASAMTTRPSFAGDSITSAAWTRISSC